MALFTLLARSTDGIPLVTTSDSANSDFLKKALYVVKSLDKNSPSKCSIKIDNNSFFHYLIEDHVCYMVETDSKYPKQLAFDYLEEVRKHFVLDQKDEVYRYGHAYAAIKFEPDLDRIRKKFLNPNAPNNLEKLNNNLYEIQSIMQKNINEILKRGDKMESVENRSKELLTESLKFRRASKWANIKALYDKYSPVFIIIAIFILYLIFRWIY